MDAPTLRSLARSLGISHATVSSALRGTGRVGADTVQRVQAAAKAAGYRSNPLASAIMSEMRRSRRAIFRGAIAAIDIEEAGRPTGAARYRQEIFMGAAERAAELGFTVERFASGPDALPPPRLDAILRARGIRGVILLPFWSEAGLSGLDWCRYAAVCADCAFDRPVLPSVCPDHYGAMLTALGRLRALGYRQPGLFIAAGQDARVRHRWQAAFLLTAARHGGLSRMVPPFEVSGPDRTSFLHWWRLHRPDVVLSHHAEAMAWMEAAGASVPETHGFACLNVLGAEPACSGLDLRPRSIGAIAVERVMDRLNRNEIGPCPGATSVSVPAAWVQGPTLREGEAEEGSPAPATEVPASEPVDLDRGDAGLAVAGGHLD